MYVLLPISTPTDSQLLLLVLFADHGFIIQVDLKEGLKEQNYAAIPFVRGSIPYVKFAMF